MWFFPTKKEVNKEFKKIKESFKERDLTIEKLRENIKTNSLKIATLEGSYLILSNKYQSQSQASLKQVSSKSLGTIETKLIQKIRKNKKSLVLAEIMKLMPTYSVIEIFNRIVLERKLCSKASFYRYVDSLKSQKFIETETKIETNKER